MKFQYFLPEETEVSSYSKKFLPMIAFIIFSNYKQDQDSRLQGIYTRRIPQIMKMKVDALKHFNTNFILPLDRSSEPPVYLETKTDSPWTNPEFIVKFEKYDYMIGGSLSLDNEYLKINIYSHLDKKNVFEKEYKANKELFIDLINDFLLDTINFFEISLTDREKQALKEHPTSNATAMEYLMKALDNDPYNPLKNDDSDYYTELLEYANRNDPESKDIYRIILNYVENLVKKGSYNKAESLLKNLIATSGYNKSSLFLMTKISILNKGVDTGLQTLGDEVKKNEEFKTLYYKLARYYMETDRNELTNILFEKALEISNENSEIFDSYGYFLISTGNKEKAYKIFNGGLKNAIPGEITFLNTAQINAESGKLDKAAELYEKVSALYPHSPRVQASRSIFFALTNENIKARSAIMEALDTSPENPSINLTAAYVFSHLKDRENAERFAKTTIDLQPGRVMRDEAEYLYSRISAGISEEKQNDNRDLFLNAIMEMRKKNYSKTTRIIDDVLKIEPNFWRAWYIKGICLRIMENYDEALESFSNVDELFSDQVALQLEIGKCYMAKEDFHIAFPHIRFAFKNRPQDPSIMGNMALVYMYLGRLKEAEILFQQVKAMDPLNQKIEVYFEELERMKKRKKSSRGNGGTDV